MMSRLIFAAVMLVTSTAISLSDDMTGQASIIDGDTLDIHGNRIRLWGVDAPEGDQLCRGEDSLQYRCGAKAANELDAFIAKRCAMASRWTGRSIRKVDTIRSSVKQSTPGAAYGRGVTSSRGCFACAFGKAGSPANVRMTPTPILENRPRGATCGS